MVEGQDFWGAHSNRHLEFANFLAWVGHIYAIGFFEKWAWAWILTNALELLVFIWAGVANCQKCESATFNPPIPFQYL